MSGRRGHTRFDCDWSSDVCSSDLVSSPASHELSGMLETAPRTTRDDPLPGLNSLTRLAATNRLSWRLLGEEPSNWKRPRSEERRVGKECRSRWLPDH